MIPQHILDSVRLDVRLKLWMWKQQAGKCYLCGLDMSWAKDDANYVTFDHVIPQSKGGKFDLENIKLACCDCNRKKGDSVVAVFGGEKRPQETKNPGQEPGLF